LNRRINNIFWTERDLQNEVLSLAIIFVARPVFLLAFSACLPICYEASQWDGLELKLTAILPCLAATAITEILVCLTDGTLPSLHHVTVPFGIILEVRDLGMENGISRRKLENVIVSGVVIGFVTFPAI
jgi:hypothetical protein